jgi:hypothetical protein
VLTLCENHLKRDLTSAHARMRAGRSDTPDDAAQAARAKLRALWRQAGVQDPQPVEQAPEAPAIPLTGSLVGDHTVTGNYSPDIRFSLTPSQDFLAPLNLKTSPEGGALRLSWNGIDHILGLEAEVVGKGAGSDDVVIWTSSTSREGRGKSQGELLPPDRTSCVMSAEARKAMELPMASLTAYGKAVTLRGPGWQVDLERRSSASVPPFEGIDGKGAEQPTAPKGGGGFNPFKLF